MGPKPSAKVAVAPNGKSNANANGSANSKQPAADAITEWFQLTVIMAGLICMGAALGFERSLLPRMAVITFGHTSVATILNFVASFGLSKAVANVVAGPIADKFGRKITLIMGFVIGLPVMPYVNFAQTWNGITIMNILFGFSQGLLGSALFFLLIDVLGPSRRGIAVGIGECTIYVSTAILNVVAGDLASRYGFRPVPFWVATGFAIVGLLSTIPLRDTLDMVKAEQSEHESRHTGRSIVTDTSSAGGGLMLTKHESGDSSSDEGTIDSRPAFPPPFQPPRHQESGGSKGGGGGGSGHEGSVVFRSQESGQSNDSIPARPVGHWNDTVDDDNKDSLRTRTSATTAGISLPQVDKNGSNNSNNNNVSVPYGSTDDSGGQPPHHRRERTPLELGKTSSDMLVSSLRPGSGGGGEDGGGGGGSDERRALLAKGDGRPSYSFDSSDEEEDGVGVIGGDDRFVDNLQKQSSGGGGEPDPPLKALGKLLFTNSNFVVLCFSGMIMNFKDGFAWGSFPVFFSEFHNLSDDHTDMLVALYPLCWGFAQAFTGALSDLYGRRLFLLIGIGSCTVAVALYALPGVVWGRPANDNMLHVWVWSIADVLLGLGTACAYPALQAGAADEIDPVNRGLGLGFYRFIRDMGYVVGALVCGRITDSIGGEVGYMATFLIVALIMGVSLLSVVFVYSPIHWSERMWKVT